MSGRESSDGRVVSARPRNRAASAAADAVERRGLPGAGVTSQQRVVDALGEVAVREGVAAVTVERVVELAGVARATFYRHFAGVEECFVVAYRARAQRFLADVEAAAGGAEDSELAVLRAIVVVAAARPAAARLLMIEGLAAGPAGVRERAALVACLAELARARPSRLAVPATGLIAGTMRFVALRLGGGAGLAESAPREVSQWARSFARVAGRESEPGRLPLWPGPGMRPLAWRVECRGSPRERMLLATAAVVRERSYREATVAEIAARAGVSRRLFYRHFASKEAAFIACHEHTFERVLAACAPAFFSSGSWPERVWEAGLACTGFLSSHPLVSDFAFVQGYAAGARFTRRVTETQLAFTWFLEEGYRQRPENEALPRTWGQLIAATNIELGFQALVGGSSLELRRLLPLAAYITLAPFIGAAAARAVVADRAAAQARAPRLAHRRPSVAAESDGKPTRVHTASRSGRPG